PVNHAPGYRRVVGLVVDAGERDRELVRLVGDVCEVRVRPGHLLRVEMDVELPLLAVAVHAPTIHPPWRTSVSVASATRLPRWWSSSSADWSGSTNCSARAGSRRCTELSSRFP